ncbi:MAG: hypothetical protein ACTHKN_21655 [Achromobacter mucicolens]
MGTRSITIVSTSTGKQLVNMYRQFDGYPSGHGLELFKFLNGMQIINGISGQRAGEAANGAGCLSAQMVARFKDGIGGVYLYPVDARDCGQDYEYHVTVTEKDWSSEAPGSVAVKAIGHGETLFDGNVEDFGKFCVRDDD